MIHRQLRRVVWVGVLSAGAISAAPPPASAQDESRADIAMQNQILELRHDVDALRDQVASGPVQSAPAGGSATPGNGDALASLLNRVSALEDQSRTLQGQIEQTENRLQTQNADLTKQIGDLAFRVQTLEGGKPGVAPAVGGNTPQGLTSAPVASAGPPLPAPIAHATLQQGYAALARRDYMTAESAARETLAGPHSARTYDAQFLLAQSLAGQHSYQPAALAYDDAYTASRHGTHAQDALVGLAASLASIGAKPAACATLDKLHAEFPGARPDVRASAAAIGRRAACK